MSRVEEGCTREDAHTALSDYYDPLPANWRLLTCYLLLAQADGRVDGGIIETGKPVKQIRVDIRIACEEGVQLRSLARDLSHQHLVLRGHGQFRWIGVRVDIFR